MVNEYWKNVNKNVWANPKEIDNEKREFITNILMKHGLCDIFLKNKIGFEYPRNNLKYILRNENISNFLNIFNDWEFILFFKEKSNLSELLFFFTDFMKEDKRNCQTFPYEFTELLHTTMIDMLQ